MAVKVLADNWSQDAAVRERFLEEARLLRRLDDDHVVRVYAVGELDDGRPFFAMEWADGGTLEDRLASHRGPLPVEEATQIAAKVLDGLAVIHAMGVVHRDVKPSNVLFKAVPAHRRSGPDPEKILLGDLGLAKDLAVGSGFTVTAGTPAYMAPEQSAPIGIVDTRADLYAVASVLYEMLAGQHPRLPWSPSGAGDQAMVNIARPTDGAIPDQVWDVIARGLSFDPEDRFASAAEMATALDGFARPTHHRPLPTGTLTLFFTDIEGSTRRWEEHPNEMATALKRHDALMRSAIESAGGHVFKTIGDSFCAAFARAGDAVEAAGTAQRVIQAETWPDGVPLQVRMGLHTGECEERGGDYFGPAVNRTARLQSIAYGGQVVLSRSTADLVRDHLPPGMQLVDLGSHRLKDIERPEEVSQLTMEGVPSEFPPLRSEDNGIPTDAAEKGRSQRNSNRRAKALGIGVVALVVAAAVFAVSRPSAGSHTTHAVADGPATSPSPMLTAADLGSPWTITSPPFLPGPLAFQGLSCPAFPDSPPSSPTFFEIRRYGTPTGAFLNEYVFQFHTVAEADSAAGYLEQIVTRCGLPLIDALGNSLGRESLGVAVPSPQRYCQETLTYGSITSAGTTGFDAGAVCKDALIAIVLRQPTSSNLNIDDVSAYLGYATSPVLLSLTANPSLEASVVPSLNALRKDLLTAADLGRGWRRDDHLLLVGSPYDCGGPGVPLPTQPESSYLTADVTAGFSDNTGHIDQVLNYYQDSSAASQAIEFSETINRLCTYPAGDEATQHWTVDSKAPRACDQSFLVRPTGTSTTSSGAYKLYVRCGRAVATVLVTPGQRGIGEFPNLTALIPVLTAKTSAASR